MTRRSTLERSIRRVLECNGGVITVYKREALVAASKGSFRSGSLKAIQSKETGSSGPAKPSGDPLNGGPTPACPQRDLDLACPSSREALLGPAGTAYANNRGIVVATDGSLRRDGSMGLREGRLCHAVNI